MLPAQKPVDFDAIGKVTKNGGKYKDHCGL